MTQDKHTPGPWAVSPEMLSVCKANLEFLERIIEKYALSFTANEGADFAQGIRELKEVISKAEGTT